MKTTATLLIGFLASLLSILFITFSIKYVILTTYTFTTTSNSEVQSFPVTFYFMAIVLLCVAIAFAITAVKFFQLTSILHSKGLENKRDTNILKRIKEQKYTELFTELSKCSNVQEKEAVLATFYARNKPELFKDSIANTMRSIRKASSSAYEVNDKNFSDKLKSMMTAEPKSTTVDLTKLD